MQLTDQNIAAIRALPKQIVNPRARNVPRERHAQRDYEVHGGELRFSIYVRQSNLVPDGFSCGLLLTEPGGKTTTLARYNGSDHPHRNHLENEYFEGLCHIHTATERYWLAGKKVEHYAQPTDRYATVEDALQCLLLDWNVSGYTISNQQGLAV